MNRYLCIFFRINTGIPTYAELVEYSKEKQHMKEEIVIKEEVIIGEHVPPVDDIIQQEMYVTKSK